jgi:hypothetical protein
MFVKKDVKSIIVSNANKIRTFAYNVTKIMQLIIGVINVKKLLLIIVLSFTLLTLSKIFV